MASNFEAISGSLNITKTRGSRSSKFSSTLTHSQLSNDSSSPFFKSVKKKLSNDTNTTNKRFRASHNCLKCNKEYQYIGALKLI